MKKQYINPTTGCIFLQGENMMQNISVSGVSGESQWESRSPMRIDYFRI